MFPRTLGQSLQRPLAPEWTRRSLLNTKCQYLRGWRWKVAVHLEAAWPQWAPRRPPHTIQYQHIPHILSRRRMNTEAVCSTLAACLGDHLPALHRNAKAKQDHAQVSFVSLFWYLHNLLHCLVNNSLFIIMSKYISNVAKKAKHDLLRLQWQKQV